MAVTVNGGTSIKFNGTELQSAKVLISSIQPFGGLQKELNYLKLARGNKSRKTGTQYPSRVIPCSGKINGTSMTDLKTQIDNFQTLLEVPGGLTANLDIDLDQSGTYRRWIADPQQLDIESADSILSVNFSFNFLCPDPWGRDTSSATPLGNTTITLASATTALTLGGTASDQLPVITLTVNSLSGSSSNTITVTNPATGQALAISRLWAAGDVLIIDLLNKTIKVGGVDVAYMGPLSNMTWRRGVGSINISDDFASRSIVLTVSNLNLYK